jgi:hypothetical protein
MPTWATSRGFCGRCVAAQISGLTLVASKYARLARQSFLHGGYVNLVKRDTVLYCHAAATPAPWP